MRLLILTLFLVSSTAWANNNSKCDEGQTNYFECLEKEIWADGEGDSYRAPASVIEEDSSQKKKKEKK